MFLKSDSRLVQNNYNLILRRLDMVDNNSLQRSILNMVHEPVLRVMKQLENTPISRELYHKGYIQSPGAFLEYVEKIKSVDFHNSFIKSPGGKYNHHHSYPGGLVLHTSANVELALGMADVYKRVYRLDIDKSVLISALVLHDISKIILFPWDKDEDAFEELEISNTGAHHIFTLAELIWRDFPIKVIKAAAFCHIDIETYKYQLNKYMEAAQVIAGRPREYNDDISIEDWICSYADSDYRITNWAIRVLKDDQQLSDKMSSLPEISEFGIFKEQSDKEEQGVDLW